MASTGADLLLEHGISWLGKKAVEMGRYYVSEALRNPKIQKKAIDYTLDHLNPMIQNIGSQALDQLSTKIRPKKKYKTNRKDLDGGALYRRKPTITDKIAEAAAMVVNPTASWTGAFKLLGSQGLKGITDNVKHYKGGNIIDKALTSGIAGSPWQVDYKKGYELLTDPTLFKGPKLTKKQMIENVKHYKELYKQAKENGYKGSYTKFVKDIGVASGPTFTFPGFGGSLDIHKAIGKLPKPKGGFTLPGHKYTGPYNDLDSQVKYDPVTGEILEIYDKPTGKTDAIAMQHDVDYSVCKDDKKCKNKADRKMVKALDATPWKDRQWGHWLARNMINTKQKLGLGVKQRKTKNVKRRLVKRK